VLNVNQSNEECALDNDITMCSNTSLKTELLPNVASVSNLNSLYELYNEKLSGM